MINSNKCTWLIDPSSITISTTHNLQHHAKKFSFSKTNRNYVEENLQFMHIFHTISIKKMLILPYILYWTKQYFIVKKFCVKNVHKSRIFQEERSIDLLYLLQYCPIIFIFTALLFIAKGKL